MDNPDVLTLNEAAKVLRIAPKSLQRWDVVPFFRVGTRGDRRYKRSDIEAITDTRKHIPDYTCPTCGQPWGDSER